MPQTAAVALFEGPVITPSRSHEQLDSLLRERIARLETGEVALQMVDLETGSRLGINEQVSMHAASTMKVPVMLEIFRQAEQAEGLLLSDSIPVINEFTSIADRSKFTLVPRDDSDSTLYRLVGSRASVRELVGLMIRRSSNLATNILIERTPPANIRNTLSRVGAAGMSVMRGVEDGPAFQRGINNTTTAEGFARTLEAIARCRITSRAACAEMIEILSAQEFNDMIPAGLPTGTRVAHKTGWITATHHDGAIVFPPNRAPYVLVIMTRGVRDTLVAERLGADLSRIVWTSLTAPAFAVPEVSASARLSIDLHRRFRNHMLAERRFTQADLLAALEPHTGGPIQREEVGKSASGKPLYLYRYGSGPVRVLLWSQMHGNESTASMALSDLARYIRESGSTRVKEWEQKLTVAFLPMLNPDGAERFQRQNDFGIDINRDARALATPEGRTLKAVHERFQPQFGFNLHDQSPRTRVGNTDRLAAIALLAPPKNGGREDDDQMVESKRLAATIRRAVEPLVGGHVTRYDDSFNPRAFGDLMQSWQTRTVLIETGGWRGDPEKQYLRTVNFAALLAALDAIADGSFRQTAIELYNTLPPNGRSVNDLIITGGQIVIPGLEPYRADITADQQDTLGRDALAIAEVGDLEGVLARDTIDVTGKYLHPTSSALRETPALGKYLTPGSRAEFSVSDSPDPFAIAAGFIHQGRYRAASADEIRPAEPKPVVAACYQIELGSWPDGGRVTNNTDWTRPPERVELLWRYLNERNAAGGPLQVRPLAPASVSPFRLQSWERLPADSVAITLSTGLSGVALRLAREGTSLRGTARLFDDRSVKGELEPETSAVLRRLPCPAVSG